MKIRSKASALIVVFIFLGQVNAQTFGFQGKKNTVSISVTGGFRVFPIISSSFIFSDFDFDYRVAKYKNGRLHDRLKLARNDYRISYSRLLGKKVGLGAEFGYERYNVPAEVRGLENAADAYTTPIFNVFSYMLIAEFFTRRNSNTAPAGFSTSIGFGAKSYQFDDKPEYRRANGTLITNTYPVNTKNITAINLLVQLNYKKVLNSFMTFDVGIRFHTGYTLPEELNGKNLGTGTFFDKGEQRERISVDNMASLFSLKTGFTFLF
jgi:hypothetical protein